jgi:hypothetical protein
MSAGVTVRNIAIGSASAHRQKRARSINNALEILVRVLRILSAKWGYHCGPQLRYRQNVRRKVCR